VTCVARTIGHITDKYDVIHKPEVQNGLQSRHSKIEPATGNMQRKIGKV